MNFQREQINNILTYILLCVLPKTFEYDAEYLQNIPEVKAITTTTKYNFSLLKIMLQAKFLCSKTMLDSNHQIFIV